MIWGHKGPIALSLVHLEEALVASAVRPVIHSEASRLAVDPLTREFSSIGPLIDTKPIDLVVHPVTLVGCTIGPLIDTVAIFLAVGVISVEGLLFLQKLDALFCSNFDSLLRQYFDTDSLPPILKPGAMVPDPVIKSHLADSMSHIVDPVSLVGVPLHMGVLAKTMRVAQVPAAFIHDTIGEAHDSASMTKAAEPLPLVRAIAALVPMTLGYEQILNLGFAFVHKNG